MGIIYAVTLEYSPTHLGPFGRPSLPFDAGLARVMHKALRDRGQLGAASTGRISSKLAKIADFDAEIAGVDSTGVNQALFVSAQRGSKAHHEEAIEARLDVIRELVAGSFDDELLDLTGKPFLNSDLIERLGEGGRPAADVREALISALDDGELGIAAAIAVEQAMFGPDLGREQSFTSGLFLG